MIMSQCRLDDAKRARRAHRKRIAGIVVQRWLSFASNRLRAYRHHRRKLLLAGIVAFVTQVHSINRITRKAAILRGKFNYRRTCASFWEWWGLVQRKRALRCTCQQVHHTTTLRVLRGAWREWIAFLARQRHEQRSRAKAEVFFSSLLASKSVHAWRKYTCLRSKKAWQCALATEYAGTRRCHVFLAAWKQVAHRTRRGREVAEAKYHQACRALLHTALLELHQVAVQQCAARVQFYGRLNQVACSAVSQLLHGTFQNWATHARSQQVVVHHGLAVEQASAWQTEQWACRMCVGLNNTSIVVACIGFEGCQNA
jgi:hypothetical protein